MVLGLATPFLGSADNTAGTMAYLNRCFNLVAVLAAGPRTAGSQHVALK